MERVKTAVPFMRRIWEFSALAAAREAQITRMLKMERQLRGAVKMGRLGMADRMPS